MIRTVARLRFNSPEPSQLRANALGGIMKNGDEGYAVTYDDATGAVYFDRKECVRALHLSACAWIEFAKPDGSLKMTPEMMAASKANPEAFQKLK